jgi:hypothetical protein
MDSPRRAKIDTEAIRQWFKDLDAKRRAAKQTAPEAGRSLRTADGAGACETARIEANDKI